MASKKIKGITVEIGGDTTKLGEAIKDASKKSSDLTTELKQVNSALKFNPDSIELLTQKQQILTEKIEATSEELELLKQAQAKAQAQFEKGEIGADVYREIERSVIETESKLKHFTAQLNDCDNAIDKLGNEATQTASEFDKLTSKIKEQENQLEKLSDEYVEVVLSQGKSSKEAQELGGKISKLNSELNENKSRLNSAQDEAKKLAKSLDDVGDSAGESSGGFTVMKGALADLVSQGIQWAISSIGDLIGSLFDLSEATEEYRQMQAKLQGSAESFGYSLDYASEQYKKLYGYVGDDQMATNAITNLMGLGLETSKVDGLVEGAIATWTAYGDSIPIESLTESIAESVKVGSVTGTLADTINWATLSNEKWTNVLGSGTEAQKAFNQALADGEAQEDAFSLALEATTSEKERAELVTRLLNETYGESKATYDEVAGSIIEANNAELELKETQAELGEAMAPVNNAITEMKNEALKAIAPLIIEVANGFMDLLGWLKEHPAAMNVVKVTALALAGAFTAMAVAFGIQSLINGVNMAMTALNVTMWACPAVWIAGVIVGIVAGFIYLWNTSEEFRNFWIGLWDALVGAFRVCWDALSVFFTQTIPEWWEGWKTSTAELCNSIGQFFTDLWNGIISFFTETIPAWIQNVITWFNTLPQKIGFFIGQILGHVANFGVGLVNFITTDVPNFINGVITWFTQLPGKIWNAILGAIDHVKNWGTQIFNTAKEKISSMISNVVSALTSLPGKIWNAITGAISNVANWGSQLVSKGVQIASNFISNFINKIKALPGQLLSIGKSIVEGLWNGISSMWGWLTDKIGGFVDGVVSGFKSVFKINSPSKLIRDEVGMPISEGIGAGIEKGADMPINAMGGLIDELTETPSDINGITIDRRINSTFKGQTEPSQSSLLGELLTSFKEYMPILVDASKKQIILDSGELVGATTSKYDESMALQLKLKERGV